MPADAFEPTHIPDVDYTCIRRQLQGSEIIQLRCGALINAFETVAVETDPGSPPPSENDPPMLLLYEVVIHDLVGAISRSLDQQLAAKRAESRPDDLTKWSNEQVAELFSEIEPLLKPSRAVLDVKLIEKLTPSYVDDDRFWVSRSTALERLKETAKHMNAKKLGSYRSRCNRDPKNEFFGIDSGKRIWRKHPTDSKQGKIYYFVCGLKNHRPRKLKDSQ